MVKSGFECYDELLLELSVNYFVFVEPLELLLMLPPKLLSCLLLPNQFLFDALHSKIEVGLIVFGMIQLSKGRLDELLGVVVDCEKIKLFLLEMA